VDTQRAVLILKRAISVPKHIWRLPSTRRALQPLSLEPLVARALEAWEPGLVSPAIVEHDISEIDGTASRVPVARMAQRDDWAGVFHLSFSEEQVKLKLSHEACRREVISPRRSSQHIAELRLWKPIRVILNGKADWPSGRYYYVRDYHVVLCAEVRPESLGEVQIVDFQADLA
jgi:hypothetical protein